MIDLRNHGNSASLSNLNPPHDIPAAARDVANLIKGEGWDSPDAMIAHSLGGKVVLEFAKKAASGTYGAVKPPKQVNFHHYSVVRISDCQIWTWYIVNL